jgi:sugar lactone lactonase YvrE
MNSFAEDRNLIPGHQGEFACMSRLLAVGALILAGLCSFPNASADTLAVSSMVDNKIYYVFPDGSASPLTTINYYPEGVAFGPGSTAIHVVNWGSYLINRVSSSGYQSTFVTNSVDPYGLAFDSQTNLFVACSQIGRVKKISPAKVVTDFASVPGAYGLAIDAADNVFVAGFGSRLSRITRNGSSSLFGPAIAGTLRGVAVDANGYIYVASLSGTITRISQSGVGGAFATGLPETVGLAFDSAGNLYAAHYAAGRISKIDTNGAVTSFATLPGAKWITVYPVRRFNPGAVVVSLAAGETVLTWTGNFTLQSGSDPGGPFVDLTAARSPYTNAFGAEPQRFFRLRN